MKFAHLAVMAALVVLAMSKPQGSEAEATIDEWHHQQDLNGYNYRFKTSNGIQREETGKVEITGPNEEDKLIDVVGSYQYTGRDGKTVTVEYVANTGGYQPRITIN